MNQKNRMVTIIFTDTGTWLSRAIRLYTRQELNHVSIVLDQDFKDVYSFGRKDANNPFSGGFVKENLRSTFFEDADCAIYRCRLSEAEYERIKTIIRHFERRAEFFRYNFLGLLGVMFNRPVKRSCAYFARNLLHLCSNEQDVHSFRNVLH